MKIANLSSYVDDCLGKDGSRDHFMARVDKMAPDASARDKDGLRLLAEDYLTAVIGLLKECEAAADAQEARSFADPLLKIAVQYFFDPDDLIPDSMGLYGLIDDAYLAHRFIIGLSDLVYSEKGFPLIPATEEEHIATIREIIGEDIAARLDDKVEANIRSVAVRNQMARLSMLSGTLPTHDSALWARVKADRERIAWKPRG